MRRLVGPICFAHAIPFFRFPIPIPRAVRGLFRWARQDMDPVNIAVSGASAEQIVDHLETVFGWSDLPVAGTLLELPAKGGGLRSNASCRRRIVHEAAGRVWLHLRAWDLGVGDVLSDTLGQPARHQSGDEADIDCAIATHIDRSWHASWRPPFAYELAEEVVAGQIRAADPTCEVARTDIWLFEPSTLRHKSSMGDEDGFATFVACRP